MELFIQIRDGQPFEHPIFGDNFRQAFPNVDPDNLPLEFARFKRVETPTLGPYEVYEGVAYQWQDGAVADLHAVRAMTPEEVAAKQEYVKSTWAQNGYASWVFDEVACVFKPPVEYPTDGEKYRWDEPTNSWISQPTAWPDAPV
jgi:hypothetical protein